MFTARIIFDLTLVIAFLLLPGTTVVILALIGAALLPYYLEGLVAVFLFELAFGPPITGEIVPFLGTFLVIAIGAAFILIKPRIIAYT